MTTTEAQDVEMVAAEEIDATAKNALEADALVLAGT
jgi:hypothetical protein